MKKLMASVVMVLGLAGCATTYVVKPKDEMQTLSLSNTPLLSVGKKGNVVWHRKPEEVVDMLVKYIVLQEKQIQKLTVAIPKPVEKLIEKSTDTAAGQAK